MVTPDGKQGIFYRGRTGEVVTEKSDGAKGFNWERETKGREANGGLCGPPLQPKDDVAIELALGIQVSGRVGRGESARAETELSGESKVYVCACMRVCVCSRPSVCVSVCGGVVEGGSMCVCACVCAFARLYVCVRAGVFVAPVPCEQAWGIA